MADMHPTQYLWRAASLQEWPELEGKKRVLLNPDDSYVLSAKDQVLVLAEDDGTYSAQEME
eukprot:scaffold490754_cov39-Prasinocladus_malaysianus.AAC.1